VPELSEISVNVSSVNDMDMDMVTATMARTGVKGEPSSSNGPHRMRITSGGQVSGYVNFALTFLKVRPNT
jgi:hypothetical protein